MAWQYCTECKNDLNPMDEDIIRQYIKCELCGENNEVSYLDERRQDLLVEMYLDIQQLKNKT